MIEQSVSLASNGVVKVPGYEQLVRFGYTKNRGVYRLHVDATGEWAGLAIRCFWHVPDGKDPASSLVVDGYVAVPASVTAQPGNGCVTFEGSDGSKTVTSADLRYRVSANSGTEDGTPTPDSPVPIVSAGDGGSVAVKVTGKNLLDFLHANIIKTGWAGNYTRTDDTLTVRAKDGWNAYFFVNPVPGKRVSVSLTYRQVDSKTGDADRAFTLGSSDKTSYPSNPGFLFKENSPKRVWTHITASVVSGLYIYLFLRLANEGVGEERTIEIKDFQLELGTTATAYSPYREQLLTLPTPTGLPGIPVPSGGNYTDPQGQQWVCDEVDLERGVKVKRVNAVDLSTCVITGVTNLAVTKRLAILLPLKGKDYTAKALCNRLPFLVSFTSDTIHFYVDTNNAQVFIPIDAKNPEEGEYILFYALATPIETPLTTAEIAAYKALTAYSPDTVVQASDGAGVKLDYQRDVNLVVKNLEDAIASMTTT